MITTIYTGASNTSSRKAIRWFQEQGLPYREVNIIKDGLTKSELKELLVLSEYGVQEFIKRSVDATPIDELKVSEAIDYILRHPNMMRIPIICNGKKLHVGFHDEEIRTFIPKKDRPIYLII